MGRVIHFEINVDDPERAVAFYRQVFGWKIETWGGPVDYWLISTGPAGEPGIDGAITHRSSPGVTTVNTIAVDSLDETLAKVIAGGGKAASPKNVVPGVGTVMYCQDSEGNLFSILQPDPNAQ